MPYKDPEKAKAAKKKWDQEHRNGKRHNTWLFIFYPQDVPGWEEEMEENGVECLVSPLHNKDKWTPKDEKKNPSHKAGKLKVDHRHGIAHYENGVTYEQFREDFGFLSKDGKGPKNVKYAKSIAASTAYLDHGTEACKRLGKAKYDPAEVLEFCGANYLDWKSRVEDVHAEMKKMRAYIREHDITEFADFQDWCDENNDEWSRLLDLKCAWAIGNYIDRCRGRNEAKKKREQVERARKEYEDSVRESSCSSPAGGLSATPPQGASEPRTPNPGGDESQRQPVSHDKCETVAPQGAMFSDPGGVLKARTEDGRLFVKSALGTWIEVHTETDNDACGAARSEATRSEDGSNPSGREDCNV